MTVMNLNQKIVTSMFLCCLIMQTSLPADVDEKKINLNEGEEFQHVLGRARAAKGVLEREARSNHLRGTKKEVGPSCVWVPEYTPEQRETLSKKLHFLRPLSNKEIVMYGVDEMNGCIRRALSERAVRDFVKKFRLDELRFSPEECFGCEV